MLKIKVEGMDKLQAEMRRVGKQTRFGAAKALNATAKLIVQAENEEIARIIDRPLPKTLRAVEVLSYARAPERLEVVVALRGQRQGGGAKESMTAGAKGTIEPVKYMIAHIVGGQRAAKRFEVALIQAGVMPEGKQAVFAKRSHALDAYGNLPGSKIQQILAWFQAYPEGRGFKSNMTARTKANLAAGKRKGLKWGFAYFRGGRDTGLPDGIWERHYPNGQAEKSFVRPVLIYVSPGQYRRSVKFDFKEIAVGVTRKEWSAQFNRAFAEAMKGAK